MMPTNDQKNFAKLYETEVDQIKPEDWQHLLDGFSDANIYHTWGYEAACHPRSRSSRFVLRKGGSAVAATQLRIVDVPMIRRGIAYIRWGPMWRRKGAETNPDDLRACLRGIFQEYAIKERLTVRIEAGLLSENTELTRQILSDEGFRPVTDQPDRRTMMLDLRPSLHDIYLRLHQGWRRALNRARKENQELIVGDGDQLFAKFEEIYSAMLARKQFISNTDVGAFRRLQQSLPDKQKMVVVLCPAGGAGAIISALGDTAIYLFGASDGVGLTDNSSYLVHWRAVELVKASGCRDYNLNGVNEIKNPGGFRFKSGLAGKGSQEIKYHGQFEASADPLSRFVTGVGFRWLRRVRDLAARRTISREA